MMTKLTEKMFFSCSPAHIAWKLKSEFKKNKNGGMRNKVRKFVVEMILLL